MDYKILLTDKILPTALHVLIMIAVGLIAIKVLLLLERRALNVSKIDKSLYTFILRASKIILLIILAIMALQTAGVGTSSLVAILGAAGAAAALAMRDSLSNVAGGIIILLTKPFKKDDYIRFEGDVNTEGVVEKVDLLTTVMHTWDNKVVTVPNGKASSSVIENYTAKEMRRVDCQFNVSANLDVDLIREIMLSVAERCRSVHENPEPFFGCVANSNGTLMVEIKAWCNTTDYYDVLYFLQEEINKEFKKNGIDTPITAIGAFRE